METLTEAMRRPRTEGYVHDVRAFKGGQLRCGTCGFLLAIVCPGGCLAQFSAAFGPAASLDTEVLQGLAHIPNK